MERSAALARDEIATAAWVAQAKDGTGQALCSVVAEPGESRERV